MILMHAAVPYILDRLLAHVETKAKSSDSSPELARFSAFIPALRHIITVIHRCHLAAFYLHGIFCHISKRISGTRYVSWNLVVYWHTVTVVNLPLREVCSVYVCMFVNLLISETTCLNFIKFSVLVFLWP